jgi:hypothetical protein
MDEHLQRAVENLRKEKCPPEVLGEVRRRVQAEVGQQKHSFGFRMVVSTSVALLILASVVFISKPAPKEIYTSNQTELVEKDSRQIIEETQIALASIGRVLISAGRSTETILSEQILPPLRGSVQTIKDKLEN